MFSPLTYVVTIKSLICLAKMGTRKSISVLELLCDYLDFVGAFRVGEVYPSAVSVIIQLIVCVKSLDLPRVNNN